MESTDGWDAAGSCSLWVENTLLEGEVWWQWGYHHFPRRHSLRGYLPPDAPFISITFVMKNGWLHVLPLGMKINVNSSSTKASYVCWLKETEETGGWLRSVNIHPWSQHPAGSCIQEIVQLCCKGRHRQLFLEECSTWTREKAEQAMPLSSNMPLCVYPWGWLWLGIWDTRSVFIHHVLYQALPVYGILSGMQRGQQDKSAITGTLWDLTEEGAQMKEEKVWQCHHRAG